MGQEVIALQVKKKDSKTQWCKSYHPYFSDTKAHDYIFVKTALDEMASKVNNINSFDVVVIESDNSIAQYKSAKHFNNLQKLSNRLDKNIIHLYEIAGHGKSEVMSHWKVH